MSNIWNVESLKEHEDAKIKHLEKKTDLQFKLNQIALDKAEAESKLHFASLNEWRAQNKDERSMFATKQEMSFTTKLVYIGLGIVLAVQFLVMLYVNLNKQ